MSRYDGLDKCARIDGSFQKLLQYQLQLQSLIQVCIYNITVYYFFLIIIFVGSCSDQDFNGCCIPGESPSCLGSDGICYCDQVCYSFGDCCHDIQNIGCYASKKFIVI